MFLFHEINQIKFRNTRLCLGKFLDAFGKLAGIGGNSKHHVDVGLAGQRIHLIEHLAQFVVIPAANF